MSPYSETNTTLLFALVLLSVIFSCRRTDDPPAPCIGVTVDKSPLNLKWSTPGTNSHSFARTFPIQWKDKVVFGDGNFPQRIVCYDGVLETLIWEVTIEGLVTDDNLKLSGDKLYWANDRALWSLDLNSATPAKVCEFGQGYLSRNFALWNDLVFCSLHMCIPPCDTLTGVGYRVDIQTGTYQEVYRKVQRRAAQYSNVLLDPIISTNSDGDTLFCFMESDIVSPSYDYLNRFVCVNLTRGITAYSPPALYYFYHYYTGTLNVHDGKAYVPIGDTVYCFSTENGATLWQRPMPRTWLTIKEGYLIASPDGWETIVNLDLDDGHIIWRSGYVGYNIAQFQPTFVENGHFYFIGEYALCAVDLTNGCLLSRRYAPVTPPYNGNLSNGLALSSDGKTIYLRQYPNLIAAVFSD